MTIYGVKEVNALKKYCYINELPFWDENQKVEYIALLLISIIP